MPFIAKETVHGPACSQEAGLMAAMRHRNIVNFLGVCAVSHMSPNESVP